MRPFQLGIVAVIFAATLTVFGRADEPSTAVYDRFPESERPALVAAYLKHLESLSREIESANVTLARARGKATKAVAQRELDRLQAQEELVRKFNDPPYIAVSMRQWTRNERAGNMEWQIGAVGICDIDVFRLKVIDEKSALLMGVVAGQEKQVFVAKGWNTGDSKNGESVKMTGPLWVSGTTSYISLTGKNGSCSVVEPFDWEKYKKQNAKPENK